MIVPMNFSGHGLGNRVPPNKFGRPNIQRLSMKMDDKTLV
jgi:hypothetical protein